MSVSPVVTFVNLATLPWVDRVAAEIHQRMRALAHQAAVTISKWYEEHHYHEELHKATEDEIAAAQKSIDEAIDSLKWDGLFEPLYEYMAKMYQAGADVPTIGGYRPLDLNLLEPDLTAVSYAERRSAELVGKKVMDDGSIIDNPNPEWAITPELREDIRKTVEEALEGEPSPQELARDIEHLAGFQPYRARMIARTELAFAYNSGHHDQAHRMGYTQKSSLLGSMHKQPDECDENAAEGWIPMEQLFRSGDEMPPYHPNCVCDLVYRRKEGDEEEDWGTATAQTGKEVTEELQATGTPYTPSTPEEIQKPAPVSSYLPLREVFDNASTWTTADYKEAARRVAQEAQRWTDEERGAVREYTRSSAGVNRALRDGSGRYAEEIQSLTSAIDRIRVPHSLRVLRGVGADVGKETLELLRQYAVDPAKLVNDPLLMGDRAFTSTTTSETVADSFLRTDHRPSDRAFRVLVRTTLPEGSPAMAVGELSHYEDEEELLLKPSSVHRVVGVQAKPEVYITQTSVGSPRIYLNDQPLAPFDSARLQRITPEQLRSMEENKEVTVQQYPGKLPPGESHSNHVGSHYYHYGVKLITLEAVYLPDAALDEVEAGKEAMVRDFTKVAYAGEPAAGSIRARWADDVLLLIRRRRAGHG